MADENPITVVVERALRTLFSYVPGTSVEGVSIRNLRTPDVLLDVVLAGWGPSLHARRLPIRISVAQALLRGEMVASGRPRAVVEAEVASMHPLEFPAHIQGQAAAADGDVLARIAAEHLAPTAATQLMLAGTAAENGFELPLPIPSSPEETEIDHLHVDRALADLLLRDEDPSAAHRMLRTFVWRAVRESGSDAERSLGVVGASDTDPRFGVHCEEGVPCVWFERLFTARSEMRVAHRAEATRQIAGFDGWSIRFEHGLPRGVDAATTGDQVGEFLATGVPTLPDRRIVRISTYDDGSAWIELEPDTIPIGSLAWT